MTKKFIDIIFTMLFAIMIPLTVFAEDAATSGTCGDNITWSFDTATETLTLSGTGAMEEYNHPDYIPWKAWRYTYITGEPSIKHIVVGNGITSISPYAFYQCSLALDVSLPEGITTIGEDAFYNCSEIAEINIPSTVTTIDYSAFESCKSLTDITIPASVTSLYASSFSRCEALQAINVDANNKDYASENGVLFNKSKTTLMVYPAKYSLSEYIIPSSVKTLSSGVFKNNESLTKVVIPDGVTKISQNLFEGCTNLQEVVVPDSVTSIEAWAFDSCKSLKKINIPYGMTKIETCTFMYCESLESITIPDTVTEISTYAFYRCESLESIEIPSSVKKIWMEAFYGCSSVKSITLNEGLEEIGMSCFKYCKNLESITIPATLTNVGNSAFAACSALKEINVAAANPNFTSENGVLYSKDKATLILYPTSKTDTSYTIKSGVKRIDNSAFENCTHIQEVIIPEGVEEIGHSAFAYCYNLTDILFPSSLKKIEGYAFRNAYTGGKSYSNLEKITYIGLAEDWSKVECADTSGVDSEDIIYSSNVTFDYASNGGSSAGCEYVIVGIDSAVDLTPIATKNGWEFIGWNTDKNAHTKLNEYIASAPVSTLYAIYKKDVTASFYSDGELLKQEKVTIYNNETATAEAPVMENKPIDAQYTNVFKGWDGNYENITADTSVNAVYEKTINRYTVKFMHNGEALDERTLEYGSKVGTLPTAPTADNCIFVGYFDGETEITADTVVKGNITAVAKYVQFGNVTYNYSENGGTSCNKETDTLDYGSAVDLTPIAVKDGWTFVGWNTDKNAETALNELTMESNSVSLYAIYKKEITVNFYSDATLLKTESFTIYNNKTATVTAPENPVKDEDKGYTYEFTGWDKAFENLTQDTDINAVFAMTPKKYTVTFIYNDETIGEITVDYNSKIGTLPTVPTLEGYVFAGYFDGETRITADTVVTSNITAVAKYLSTDISIENFEVSQSEDSRYNWSIDVKCDTDEIVGTLIIALYDENDAVVGTQIVSVSEDAGTNEITNSLEASETAIKAKAFLWTDMATLQPITDAVMAEI